MQQFEHEATEQGSETPHPKYGPASVELASHSSLKWLIGLRSLMIVSPLALLCSMRWPILGLDLELGVLAGTLNMCLVMSANERLLDNRVSRAQRSLENFVRLIAMGALFAFVLYWRPWWAIGIALAGFYTPMLLQIIEVTKRYRTGKM